MRKCFEGYLHKLLQARQIAPDKTEASKLERLLPNFIGNMFHVRLLLYVGGGQVAVGSGSGGGGAGEMR